MVPLHPRWQRASVQRRYKVQFRFLHMASQEGVSHVPVKLSKPPAETVSALTDTATYFSDKRLLLIACMIRLPTAIENIGLFPLFSFELGHPRLKALNVPL